jgi:hypothetical protein
VRDVEKLPKVPRRMKQVSRKFIHNKRLTRRERRRLVRWLQARHRDIGAPPMRQLPDGRYSLLDVW